MPGTMLAELRDATLGYGRTAILTATSMRIRAGDRIALLGDSGAGKSTVLACLAGQTPTLAGGLTYFGPLASSRVPALHRPEIAWVPHEPALVADLYAITNVLHGCLGRLRLPRFHWRTYPRAERAAAADLLTRLGLAHVTHVRCGRLSRGQQQRVAVGRALLQRPALVLLDEPTSSLDPQSATALLRLLDDLVSCGSAVVLALHDERLAEVWATRRMRLVGGRLVEA
ncbi:ATP-binding cassette domain-containing protein [Micromonospora sp. CPCC 205561]|uniref:ATP-binding cassette domain-containing protein n=1 Tax=Micromonospora sp. CPCC 205561 TaxID=3122407 RepID=UPI002FF1DD55